MAGILSVTAKAVVMACDALDAMEAAHKLFQDRQEARETDWLQMAHLVHKVVCLGFTCAEAGALLNGSSSEMLVKMKEWELLPRAAGLPIQFIVETRQFNGTFQGTVRLLEKGLIMPMADICRVAAEASEYQEQNYLNAYQKNPDATRPIYEAIPDGEGAYEIKKVGERPIVPEECTKNIQDAAFYATTAIGIRAAGKIGALEKVATTGERIYERLAAWLRPNMRNAAGEGGRRGIEVEEFDLLASPRIPVPLHEDVVFRRFICAITHEPVRDPVLDPNGHTLYERAAIVHWLTARQNSPVTRQPMTIEDLREMPALRLLIEDRLKVHQEAFRAFFVGRLQAPANVELQEAAHQEYPTEE